MRYPKIYDLNLRCTGELRTAEISDLKLKDTPLSCVTVTVPTKDIGSFGYRQFVEIFDAAGKRIDLFRVTEIPKGVYGRAGTKKLKCDQVLCTLSDDITPTYMQIGGNGQPLESCIRQVLACQQPARWKLGRCDFVTLYEYSFASEGLLSALLKLIEPIPDALMTTDTTSYPWTLNVVRADDTDATELRYSRNMEEISEEVLDTDFATRLYPLGYGEGVNQLNIKSVNGGMAYIDSPTQALWGVVSKPYVDTTITDAATLLAQGRAALELCCNPHVSYGVTCKDISILTGEPLDAFYTGRMARIIYRDYGLTIRARVREIHYPKPITEPWNAKLTIANRSADVASVIAQLQRTSRIELYHAGHQEQECPGRDRPGLLPVRRRGNARRGRYLHPGRHGTYQRHHAEGHVVELSGGQQGRKGRRRDGDDDAGQRRRYADQRGRRRRDADRREAHGIRGEDDGFAHAGWGGRRAYGLCENVRRRQHVGDGRRERLDRFRRRRKYRRQPKRRRRDDLDGRSGKALSWL